MVWSDTRISNIRGSSKMLKLNIITNESISDVIFINDSTALACDKVNS
jgi:hypothetical protein